VTYFLQIVSMCVCVDGHSNVRIWRVPYRIEAEEKSPKDGDMMMQCPHFFLLFTPPQQPLTYLNQPKMFVASEGHLVVFDANIHVYLDVDGWIILGWISRRWDVGIWTGLGWPRIETGGRRL